MREIFGALSLARMETRGKGLVISLNGLFIVSMGLLALSGLSGVFVLEGFGAVGGRIEALYNALFTDGLFVLVCASLGVSVVTAERVAPVVRGGWRAPLSPRGLAAIRRQPLSTQRIVGGRLISSLLVLSLNAALLFVGAYLFTGLGDLGGSYLWFVGIWLGFGLLVGGLYLVLELTPARCACGGATSRGYALPGSFVIAAALFGFVVLFAWAPGPALVEGTAALAQTHGALAASSSILAGVASLVILCRLAVCRLEKRSIPL